MKLSKMAVAAAAMLMLAGCANNGQPVIGNIGMKEGVGTLLGGAGGGFLGSIGGGSGKLIATVGGTLIGGFLGNQIGQSLDKADKLTAEKTAQNALENAPTSLSALTLNTMGIRSVYT